MSEIIPERGPKLKLSGGWKVAIVVCTLLLAVWALDWQMMDDGNRGIFMVATGFTAFGWGVWIFS